MSSAGGTLDAGTVAAQLFQRLHRAALGLVVFTLLVGVAEWPATRRPVDASCLVVLAAATAAAGRAVTAGRPLGRLRLPPALLAVAVPAVARSTATPFGLLDWSYLIGGVLLVLVLLDRRPGTVAGWLLLQHGAVTIGQAALAGASGDRLVQIAIFGSMQLSLEFSVYLAAPVLRRGVEDAARTAAREERLRLHEEAAEQLARDARLRYAAVANSASPLLAGLADGTLDPADPAVRRACAVEASRMRRLFAESDDVPDPLAHELRACADLAERSGVAVGLGVRGAVPDLPLAVRRQLTEPVLAVLAACTGGDARVTLTGTPRQVRVAVIADVPADGVPPASPPADSAVTVTRVDDGGRVWVEAAWRA